MTPDQHPGDERGANEHRYVTAVEELEEIGQEKRNIETHEQGEDAAKEAYKKALKEDGITASVRQILVKQQSHVQQVHDQVKAFRDRKAA